jgi:hypothetical protein
MFLDSCRLVKVGRVFLLDAVIKRMEMLPTPDTERPLIVVFKDGSCQAARVQTEGINESYQMVGIHPLIGCDTALSPTAEIVVGICGASCLEMPCMANGSCKAVQQGIVMVKA